MLVCGAMEAEATELGLAQRGHVGQIRPVVDALVAAEIFLAPNFSYGKSAARAVRLPTEMIVAKLQLRECVRALKGKPWGKARWGKPGQTRAFRRKLVRYM